MKKKITVAAFVSIFAIFSILSFSLPLSSTGEISLKNVKVMAKANAQVNPECPNGCVPCGLYCYCYQVYEGLREYQWPKQE
jgi:hypothetical protein